MATLPTKEDWVSLFDALLELEAPVSLEEFKALAIVREISPSFAVSPKDQREKATFDEMRNKLEVFLPSPWNDVDARLVSVEEYLQDTSDIGLEMMDREMQESSDKVRGQTHPKWMN